MKGKFTQITTISLKSTLLPLFAFVLLSILFTGCEDIEKGTKVEDFAGSFTSGWVQISHGTETRTTYTFGTTTLTILIERRLGGVPQRYTTYTYNIAFGSTYNDGKKVNITLTEESIRPDTTDDATLLNDENRWGITTWSNGSTLLLSSGYTDPECAINSIYYWILKVKDDMLYVGDRNSTFDGTTDAKRPTTYSLYGLRR